MSLRLPERPILLPLQRLNTVIRLHCRLQKSFGSEWQFKSRDQAITTTFSHQDLGMGRITFNFLTQAVNVGFKCVR